ncbi:DUF2867 domain-containing protein [Pseudoalteromonas luteoviolacea]|uniref:DUF2867 domain-containing protein n=1 Tax=Pseudoalteromonas luteoviolacea S4054 TaxID=1129367 RepID=A0A0F6A7E2_9GAMM|nr:DUF2867 domain-containing protein [Pseudoalteromonas luteoviolacea]AOT10675.1 hypothetical protein S4054249_22720 [Pseudoalteromonas luteoviolacea]AOT15256.1 hypothetical protein S40542_20875 [Pseudoalteromonas luteoviolacea]AOT20494.1 hypothetical protein S4054_22635 [Pseudoalteromonas luteoviolacea]KKE82043.1 hypothetical protein N479_20040 [Pseudoalteromonas luteoviolacea S4054]KZN67738.1 hypothetical protein N481_23875 [Pseudoalteromonas luteoviolacea S4047-1]
MNEIPSSSLIKSYVDDADFYDCFVSDIDFYRGEKALELFVASVSRSPGWFNFLMAVRNKLISRFGMKDLGAIDDVNLKISLENINVGDRVGIFTLYKNTQHEVILEDKDKHLNVKVSFYVVPNCSGAQIYATTVVHINNTFGKWYMFFIKPVHKLIVPTLLQRLCSMKNEC